MMGIVGKPVIAATLRGCIKSVKLLARFLQKEIIFFLLNIP